MPIKTEKDKIFAAIVKHYSKTCSPDYIQGLIEGYKYAEMSIAQLRDQCAPAWLKEETS